jgi:hypothetical protein
MAEKGGENLMGTPVEWYTLMALIGVASFVLGAFFALRAFYRYKGWQAGEKDELWTFLSLVVGCGSLILIGIPALSFGIGVHGGSIVFTLAELFFVGILLGLAAIGLTTFYIIQKWRAQK